MRRWFPLFLILTLAAGGCVSSSDVERLQEQIIDLHDQITELKRQASSKSEVEKLNETLASQTRSILQSNADLSVKVSDLEQRLQNAQGGIEQANYRIDRLVQQINQNQRDLEALRFSYRQGPTEQVSPSGESAGQSPPLESREIIVQAPPATEDPLALYQSAYRDYQRGNFDFAIEGFQEFLQANPTSDLADNSAYWIGECFYSQQKYRDAIRNFDIVINDYSQSDKVSAALLKKGYSYIELGERAQGVVQLQYVIHEHPTAPEAALAREKLRSLGIEAR